MQRNQPNQLNRRPRQHYNNHGKKTPRSSFVYGMALLIVFILGIQSIQNLAGIIAPQTFSSEVLAFSSNSHLQYYCADHSVSEKDPIWGELCFTKESAKQTQLREKYAPIVKDFERHNYFMDLFQSIFFMIGLFFFIRVYRK